MNILIACCGLNCEACEAFIAFKNDDNQLRVETAEKWKKQYGAEGITPEMINCSGCRNEGPKLSHCAVCKIRICAQEKSYETCGSCEEMSSCELIAHVHSAAPEAKRNLQNVR